MNIKEIKPLIESFYRNIGKSLCRLEDTLEGVLLDIKQELIIAKAEIIENLISKPTIYIDILESVGSTITLRDLLDTYTVSGDVYFISIKNISTVGLNLKIRFPSGYKKELLPGESIEFSNINSYIENSTFNNIDLDSDNNGVDYEVFIKSK